MSKEFVQWPDTEREILQFAVDQIHDLVDQAQEAIGFRDVYTWRYRQIEALEVLSTLPGHLKKLGDSLTLPEDTLREIDVLSGLANETLASNDFNLLGGIGMILNRKGSQVGDPNQLEALIASLYPQESAPQEI